jgi:ABC-type phosphate transport system substrate-binding protein
MRFLLTFIAAISLGLCSWAPVNAQSSPFDGFVIIGNNTGVLVLTEAEATDVFRGKKSVWTNGKPILIVLPSTQNAGSTLIARRLFSTDSQGMHRYWLSQVFQGRTNAPVFLEAWDDIVKKVRTVDGAIALVPRGTSVPSELILQVR